MTRALQNKQNLESQTSSCMRCIKWVSLNLLGIALNPWYAPAIAPAMLAIVSVSPPKETATLTAFTMALLLLAKLSVEGTASRSSTSGLVGSSMCLDSLD